MKQQLVRRQQDFSKDKFTHQLPKIVKRILIGREIYSDEDIDFQLSALPQPDSMADINKAAALVADSIVNQHKIIIVADYDVDGACSAALASKALTAMGAENIKLVIPSRVDDGYGLSEALAHKAVLPELPGLVMTVDNGIKSHAAVELINQAGSQVVITDHHQPDDELPNAAAIVNPNRSDCSFGAKHLAGVGVCFYLFWQVRRHLIKQNHFLFQQKPPPKLADLLDLVAIGTVADVMLMDRTNRILTEQGLRRIRYRKTSAGILALLQQKSTRYLSSQDLAFGMIPRLNAAGRLGNMELSVSCLLAEDKEEASSLAKQITDLNEKRKQLARQMNEDATQLMEQDKQTTAICLYDPSWQSGLSGPLAGNLRDKYHRPTIVFAQSQSGLITGSGRSTESLSLHSLLTTIDQDNPDLLIRYGGHSIAVGLTIAEKDFNQFKQAFLRLANKQQPQQPCYVTDGELDAEELNSQTARMLINFAPWGKGFPPPLFDGHFQVIKQELTASLHLKLQLRYRNLEPIITAFKFHHGDKNYPLAIKTIRAIYSLATYPYGENAFYLKIQHLEPL